MVKRRGRELAKNMYEGPTDMDNTVGTDCGSGEWGGLGGGGKRGKIGTTVTEQFIKRKRKK